jgi:hypothetical protein
MALNYTVTLTGGTDNGPYTIYYDTVSNSNIASLYSNGQPASNLTLSQVQSGVIVSVPNSSTSIIFVNTNPTFQNDCTSYSETYYISQQPTQPPQTPTPTGTNEPTSTPTPTPTSTQDVTYKFCQCDGTENSTDSVELQANAPTPTPLCIYLSTSQLGGVPSAGDTVYMSDDNCYEYVGQEEGVVTELTINPNGCTCNDPTPTPTPTPTSTDEPTPTPTPTPSSTPEEIRNLKFEWCADIETAPISEEITTENAQLDLPIYLTISEYGSTPSLGDKLYVDVGTSVNKCYEYVGIETGSWSDSYSIISTSCTCMPTPTPTSTSVTTEQFYKLQGCTNNYDYTVPKDAWCENGSLVILSTNYQIGDVLQIVTSCHPNAAPFCGTVISTNFTSPAGSEDAYISRTIPATDCDDALRCSQ